MTTTTAVLTGDYTIDPVHSRIGFVARHAMIAKVRGSFNDWEGTARIDGDTPANSSVRVTVRTKSIDTGNSQRDEHLRSNDFLAMDAHPEITFVSTAVEPLADDHYQVTGDLTIRGVTKRVAIDFEYTGTATDPYGDTRIGIEGSLVLNRKDFGITWNTALEGGGVLVSEKVTLQIEVEAVRDKG